MMSAKCYREKPQNVSIDLQDHSVLSNLEYQRKTSQGLKFLKLIKNCQSQGALLACLEKLLVLGYVDFLECTDKTSLKTYPLQLIYVR